MCWGKYFLTEVNLQFVCVCGGPVMDIGCCEMIQWSWWRHIRILTENYQIREMMIGHTWGQIYSKRVHNSRTCTMYMQDIFEYPKIRKKTTWQHNNALMPKGCQVVVNLLFCLKILIYMAVGLYETHSSYVQK